MRDRRKKHLTERLTACECILYSPITNDLNFKTSVEKKEYIDFQSRFKKNAPMEMEIGCGKGKFITEKALSSPNIHFIAVEKVGNVLVNACEATLKKGIGNVLFLKTDAHMLPKYFPPHSIDRIYLNFSTPFPKNRDINRRLTYPAFLEIYKYLLVPGGEIHQKTDNMHFFEYSLEMFSQNGFKLKNISLDLHHSGIKENIETEYERRFASQGQPIYRLEAYLPIQ